MEQPKVTIKDSNPTTNLLYRNQTYYDESTNEIVLGLKINVTDFLTDRQIQNLSVEMISHEYLHYLIKREFGHTATCLFDAIEHLVAVHKGQAYLRFVKKFHNYCSRKWETAIKKDGLEYFYRAKDITKDDVRRANEICNKRKV